MGEKQNKHKEKPRHPPETKKSARVLRSQGFTHREIAKKLKISTGTAYLWTIGIILTKAQKQSIEKRRRKPAPWTPAQKREIIKRLMKANTKYSKENLVEKIRDFYEKHGRIPLKKELGDNRTFRRLFGTWNNAIKAAGFEPNPELFAKREIARDGHVCDSAAERIIDDWLTENGIYHERNVRYPGTRMTADFLISQKNLMIEYFGLKNVNRKYTANLQRKLVIVKKKKLNLIALYPEDLSETQLAEKLQTIFNQKTERTT